MDQFLTLTISGAVAGAIYSLLAMGLVLNYSTSRIFNFGQGAVAFACAYVFYQLNSGLGWPVWISVIAVVLVFAPLMGFVWDRFVFRALSNADESAKIVGTIGVLIVMPALTIWVCDLLRGSLGVGFVDASQAYAVPGIGPNPPTNWTLTENLIVNSDQLIALGAAVIVFACVWALMRFTTLGLRMRASVDSPVLARLRGTNTAQVSGIAWVLSFVVAGLAGVVAAPIPGAFGLSPDNYTFALFVAATAAVVAGLRSVPVAFFVGLALGAARNLVQEYVGEKYLGGFGKAIEDVNGLRGALPYIVLFAALIYIGREQRKRRSAGVSTHTAPLPDYLADLPRWRRHVPWVVASVLLLAYGLGPADNIWRLILITGLALGVILLSFTVVTGLGGMVSLAQSTFAAVASMVTGLCMSHGWPFGPSALAGLLAAGVLGAVVSLPALRLGGVYLALATLALALLGSSVLFNIDELANGVDGWKVGRPVLGPVDLGDDRTLLVFMFVVVVLVGWLVANLQRSASGRAMIALRTAPPAAAASAVPPALTRLIVFVVSAVIAGFGGIMVTLVYGQVVGTSFPPIIGFTWLAIVVTFGVQRPHGAIVAGLVFVAMPRILSNGLHIGDFGWDGTTSVLIPQILFGLGAIGLAQSPNGILFAMTERRFKRRQARAARTEVPLVDAAPTPVITTVSTAGRTADALLELRGLRAGYEEVEVLHGIDLRIESNSTVALIGANGAGKSSLCAAMAGTLRASAGVILFKGEDITALPAHERARRGLVLVPESRGVFPALSVEDNLSMWLSSRADHDAVYERFPNLAQRRRLPAGNLSGGEQQMLSLGPLLVREPSLLIADEPSLGLSRLVSAEVMEAFQQLHESGTTLVLVEEKARDVLKLADVVGALAVGRLQWVRPKSEVIEEHLVSAYLGTDSATRT